MLVPVGDAAQAAGIALKPGHMVSKTVVPTGAVLMEGTALQPGHNVQTAEAGPWRT